MTPELQSFLEDRIPKIASEVRRGFPLIDREDFTQQCWLKALEYGDRYQDLFDQDRGGAIVSELKGRARRYGLADDQDRRARKAYYLGYRPDDEFTYSPKMIALLLSELIITEWDVAEAIVRGSRRKPDQDIRVSGGNENHDAAVDYEVMLMDVKAAYLKLRKVDQDSLVTWYQCGDSDESSKQEHEKLAASEGISYDGLNKRVQRARAALIEQLSYTADELEEIGV